MKDITALFATSTCLLSMISGTYKSHWKNKFILVLILRIFSFYAMCYQKESYNPKEGIYCIDCVSLNIDLRHLKSLQLSAKEKLISIFAAHKSCCRGYLQFALILETAESDPDMWRIEKAPKNPFLLFSQAISLGSYGQVLSESTGKLFQSSWK